MVEYESVNKKTAKPAPADDRQAQMDAVWHRIEQRAKARDSGFGKTASSSGGQEKKKFRRRLVVLVAVIIIIVALITTAVIGWMRTDLSTAKSTLEDFIANDSDSVTSSIDNAMFAINGVIGQTSNGDGLDDANNKIDSAIDQLGVAIDKLKGCSDGNNNIATTCRAIVADYNELQTSLTSFYNYFTSSREAWNINSQLPVYSGDYSDLSDEQYQQITESISDIKQTFQSRSYNDDDVNAAVNSLMSYYDDFADFITRTHNGEQVDASSTIEQGGNAVASLRRAYSNLEDVRSDLGDVLDKADGVGGGDE